MPETVMTLPEGFARRIVDWQRRQSFVFLERTPF
jgi:hypothetical protein